MWEKTNETTNGRKTYRKNGRNGKYARVWEFPKNSWWSIFQNDGDNEIAVGKASTTEDAKKQAEKKLNE